MKIIKHIFVSLIISISFLSCSNTPSPIEKSNPALTCDVSAVLEEKYLDIMTRSDTLLKVSENNIFFSNRNGETIEGYIFWNNTKNVKQYAFYNIFHEQPCFIVSYGQGCSVRNVEGTPLYISHSSYGLDTIKADTFEMFVHVALPFLCVSQLEIQKFEYGKTVKFYTNKIMKGNSLVFIDENLENGENKYLVIGTISNSYSNVLIKDTLIISFQYIAQ